MVKIIQEHEGCIGCGTCVALCPEFWEMDDDGKARPKTGKLNIKTGNYEFGVDKKDIGCNKDVEDLCPVNIIKIQD